ncbi:MAG: dihydrodipicolinate synthase family protein [Propioniciclava sp.]
MPQPPEILSALTTPFHADGSLNLAAFQAHLERLEPEVDGVFIAGTTGEFLALDPGEHATLLTAALTTFGPARVVAHVGAPSTRQSLQLTAEAVRLGAIRFAAITPYYLPASAREISRHWGAIKDGCGGELYGYIYPDVAVTDLRPTDLPTVIASGIAGIKVSGTAAARVTDYLSQAPEGFQLWSGNDADLPAIMATGGIGTVSGCAGVHPGPWVAWREAYRAKDTAALTAAQAAITAAVPVLGSSIAHLKYTLDVQGFTGGSCRMSIDPPSDEARRDIAGIVG